MTNLPKQIDDAESAPQRTFQNSQQQSLDETHKAQQFPPESLREENRFQIVGFQGISKKMENDMSALTRKCNTVKLDSTAAWTASLQANVEKMQHEIQQKTVDNQLKTAEEERIAFRKDSDDPMRYLEVECDSCLQQTAEMRADLVKAVRKEREDNSVDNSEHQSEVSRMLRQWQFSKKSGGLSSHISNTPTSSSSENYVNAFFGKTK